jgi:hypothetical protein
MTFITRNISGVVSGNKALMAIVYNAALVAVLVMLSRKFVADIKIRITIEACGCCLVTMVASVLLVFPNLYTLHFKGDKDATEDVIRDIIKVNFLTSYREFNNAPTSS